MLRRLVRPLGATVVAGAAASLATSSPAVAASAEPAPMPMRLLGNTGLQVSVLSYGFWATFGAKDNLMDQKGIDAAKACLSTARDAGINLFDNAEAYGTPFGAAELIMGEALRQLSAEDPKKWRRSDLVITTKIFWGGHGVNEKGLSVKHMREGLDAALKRMQLDYVDLVFCHRPDPFTPTETVVRGMTDLVRSGKATAWGTSEWSAQQLTEAIWYANTHGLEPPQFEQPQYNMFHRQRFESEYAPMYKAPYRLGTTIWSPLASGLLTGKYIQETPADSRGAAAGYAWVGKKADDWRADGTMAKVEKLKAYAEGTLGCTMAQLAIAWCLKNENVTTCLLGATKPQQLTETLEAIPVARKLTDADMKAIEAILGNKPEPYQGFGFDAWFRGMNKL